MTQELKALSKQLVDIGKIIEAGWIGFRLLAVSKNASLTQINEMRNAFFAGAQHLFASIMAVMDSDREPTESDLRRMSLIHDESEEFRRSFLLKHISTDGNA
jgi:hypothetical protein